jgi:hypothetical protein
MRSSDFNHSLVKELATAMFGSLMNSKMEDILISLFLFALIVIVLETDILPYVFTV